MIFRAAYIPPLGMSNSGDAHLERDEG